MICDRSYVVYLHAMFVSRQSQNVQGLPWWVWTMREKLTFFLIITLNYQLLHPCC